MTNRPMLNFTSAEGSGDEFHIPGTAHLPLSDLTPSMREISSSYRVHIWYVKTRMAGLQSREGRTMIDSVVWAQYINVTDTQTATSPQQTHCVGRQKRTRDITSTQIQFGLRKTSPDGTALSYLAQMLRHYHNVTTIADSAVQW